MDNKKKNEKLSEKVIQGMTRALRKLAESSAASNKELVVGDEYGNVQRIAAKELLKEFR